MPGTEGTGGIGLTEVWAFLIFLPGNGADVIRGLDTHTLRVSVKSRIDSRRILARDGGDFGCRSTDICKDHAKVNLFLNHHVGISHTHDLPSMYVCEGGQGREKIDKRLTNHGPPFLSGPRNIGDDYRSGIELILEMEKDRPDRPIVHLL